MKFSIRETLLLSSLFMLPMLSGAQEQSSQVNPGFDMSSLARTLGAEHAVEEFTISKVVEIPLGYSPMANLMRTFRAEYQYTKDGHLYVGNINISSYPSLAMAGISTGSVTVQSEPLDESSSKKKSESTLTISDSFTGLKLQSGEEFIPYVSAASKTSQVGMTDKRPVRTPTVTKTYYHPIANPPAAVPATSLAGKGNISIAYPHNLTITTRSAPRPYSPKDDADGNPGTPGATAATDK